MQQKDDPRISRIEEDVSGLKTDVASLKTDSARTTSSLEGMRADVHVLFAKMDRVIDGTSSLSASRGMVSWSVIAWGIALLVSLGTLGLGITGTAAAIILWVTESGDNLQATQLNAHKALAEAELSLVAQRLEAVSADVSENRLVLADYEERLRTRETNAFTESEGRTMHQEVQDLRDSVTAQGAILKLLAPTADTAHHP